MNGLFIGSIVDLVMEWRKNGYLEIKLYLCFTWHRIHDRVLAPGVTTQYSFRRQITAFERPPNLQSLNSIV